MFTPTRIAAAIAVVALSGSLLLISGPLRPEATLRPGTDAPSEAQVLNDQVMEMANENDRALLEDLYASDAIHNVVYADGPIEYKGVDEIGIPLLHPSTFTEIAPIMEIPGRDGVVRWSSFLEMRYGATENAEQVWPGIVCSYWARDGKIHRHDCLMPDVYVDIMSE